MRRNALLLVLTVPVLASCLGIWESGAETPVSVSNESGRDVVIRRDTEKWPIGVNETREIERPSMVSTPLEYEVLDAATCASITAVTVDTKTTWNSLIILPSTGPPVIQAMDLKARPPVVQTSPLACPGPKDLWTLWITNSTSEDYVILEYDIWGARRGAATIPAGEAGILREYSGGFYGRGPGVFELRDGDCHVIQRMDHADFGIWVGTIEAGDLLIKPGPLPPDESPSLWGAKQMCPPQG